MMNQVDPSYSSHMPSENEFLRDVVAGLSQPNKTLPYKYFYDEEGSQIFDRICDCEDYYLTRTETLILEQNGRAMSDWIGPDAVLFEPGAGSSVKVEALLAHLQQPVAYVPADISRDHLLVSCERLQERYPHIPILPVVADYSHPFSLPALPREAKRTVVFYPGSTIGNFQPHEATAFLARLAKLAGTGGGLLLGFDRRKDTAVLEAAYNDSEGVTKAFHLNLLSRINRELGANFVREQFAHHAPFNAEKSRIEMHLVSQCAQTVTVGGRVFSFEEGESICTEFSYKHTPETISALGREAGLTPQELWTDERDYFAVMSFVVS